MTKIIIVALCDPHNAKFRRNGERLLDNERGTCVKWVADDNLEDGFPSEEEAKKRLMEMAKLRCDDGRHDNWRYEDDDSIADLKRQVKEDTGEDIEIEWYKGPGVYDGPEGLPVLLEGEDSFRDDVVSYQVEEAELVPKRVQEWTERLRDAICCFNADPFLCEPTAEDETLAVAEAIVKAEDEGTLRQIRNDDDEWEDWMGRLDLSGFNKVEKIYLFGYGDKGGAFCLSEDWTML